MKRIAVIDIGIPPDKPNEREYWENTIPLHVLSAQWFEPLNREEGKISVYCRVDTCGAQYETLTALLGERGLRYPDDVGAPGYEERFQAVLHSRGLTWAIERIEHEYTDDELRSFPLLELCIDADPIGGDCHSSVYGTVYDVSGACPRCGTGAVQTSPLMIPLKGLPKKGEICLGPHFEWLVGAKLRKGIEKAELTGLELRQALFYRNKEPLPWWQMVSAYEMPKISKASTNLGRDTDPGWGCPVCERDMHVNMKLEPLDIVYERRDVDPAKIPDVVHTWERWGRSVLHDDPVRHLHRGFAPPFTLVKPKFLDVVRKLKVRKVEFNPVRFI